MCRKIALIGSGRNAWLGVCKNAELRCRWSNLRLTFVPRLAGNPSISEAAVHSLAGHLSRLNIEIINSRL